MAHEEFLERLATCIERKDFEACAEEAAQLAKEMNVAATELLDLSSVKGDNGEYELAYVLALAASKTLDMPDKASAYLQAGKVAQEIGKDEKIEQAIQCYKQALKVYTKETFPEKWDMTQNKLVVAYRNCIRGDRAENIEQAIRCYKKALEVYTKEDFKEKWAWTQNNIGLAYNNRIRGDRIDNIEQAIQYYNEALKIYTTESFPEQWAWTQNNLANAYSNRIRGDRADNIEQAFQYYNQALKVYTPETFPKQWALTQNNMGLAYSNRIRGDKAKNIEQAIQYYKEALRIYTPEFFPQQWATTQRNFALLLEQQDKDNDAAAAEKLYKKAEKRYKKAQELIPYDPSVHYGYAIVLTKMKRETEAEDHYLRAIELNPYNADYHINYAKLLRKKGRLFEAKKEVKAVCRIDTLSAIALATLGDILSDDGNLKEAELVYNEALQKLEGINLSSSEKIESDIHNSLGWIHSQDEKYQDAETEFKKAKSLNEDNKDAIENISLVSRVKRVPQIDRNQKIIAITLLIFLIASYILLWYKLITETVFAAQSTILLALILAVLFIQRIGYFKVASVEFKMSEQGYAFAHFKPSEMKRN